MSRSGSVRWPLVALCLYAALVPLQPVIALPDGSQLRFAAADAIATLVFVGALAWPRRRIPPGLGAMAAAIPLLALLSTLLAASSRPLSMYAVGKTAGLFYLAGLCLAAVRCADAGTVPAMLRALAYGAFWSALVGLAGFALWLGGTETSLVQGGRVCSTMTGDPNIYGGLVAVGLLATVTDDAASRWGRAVRGVVLVLALLATGSRSAVLGTVAGFAVYAVVSNRDPYAAAARDAYGLLAVALTGALALTTDVGSAAVGRLWEHHWREFTVESRLDLYARALQQFADNPLTGVGIGGFRELNSFEHGGVAQGFVVHNTYLWALVDLGVVGGLLVVGLVGAGMWRCARAAWGWPAAQGAAVVAAGLGAMAVFNLFIDGFYQRHFWVLLACAIGLPVCRPVRRTVTAPWRTRPARVTA